MTVQPVAPLAGRAFRVAPGRGIPVNHGFQRVGNGRCSVVACAGVVACADGSCIGQSGGPGFGQGHDGIPSETKVGRFAFDPEPLVSVFDAVGPYAQSQAETAVPVTAMLGVFGRGDSANERGCELTCHLGSVFSVAL